MPKDGRSRAFRSPLIGVVLGVSAIASGPAQARGFESTTRTVVEAYLADMDEGNAAAAAERFAPDVRYADKTFDFAIAGRLAIRKMLESAAAMLKPAKRQILRAIYDGEQAAIEWEASGTHAAPALGVKATGRQMTIRGVSLIEVQNGRIQTVTDYMDRAGLEKQLSGKD